ncbi:uncharacterized protein [Garra rufa]|uniref:uncharacterized protein n=1 Tax=Garra rufa TaxID=137080 RepID=UPI003CCE7A98
MFRCFNLLQLLLFYLIHHTETTSVETTPVTVKGEKGDNATLPCQFEARDIFKIDLWRTKKIFSCQNISCESGRFKKENCDVVIKNVSFSDAGKYTLRVHYNNDQTVLKERTTTYQLHIHDMISLKKGEEQKLDVLLSNTYKVLHQPIESTEWKEVWNRANDSKANDFLANETGTYNVLDFKGNILITVTVTGTGSSETLNKDDKHNGTNQLPVWAWIVMGLVGLAGLAGLVFLVVWLLIKHKVIKRPQRLNRNNGHGAYHNDQLYPLQQIRGP